MDMSANIQPLSDKGGVVISGRGSGSIFELDPEQVVDVFTRAGAVLFRDFDLDLDRFNRFSAAFSTEFMTYRGGSYVRRTVNEGKDATLLSTSHEFGHGVQDMFALPLHGEMYYLGNRPLLLWFYCVVPPAEDGETTICDGSLIFESLRPETRDLLTSRRLRYSRRYPDGEWQKIYGSDDFAEVQDFCRANGLQVRLDRDTGELHTEYMYPAVITSQWGGHRVYINNMLPVLWQESLGRDASIVRFEDGSQIPGEVVEEITAVQQRLVIPVRWQSQDLLMVDNTRFLHGRRAFKDPNREICLRMARGLATAELPEPESADGVTADAASA
jgi:alpha-ketoglutarate-dependent taurine dioxygenase